MLMTAAVALAGALVFGLARLGEAAVSRAQARTAADAAALAGIAAGREAADAVVTANGGHIVAYSLDGPELQVVVKLGDAQATARARRETLARAAPGPGQTYARPAPDRIAAGPTLPGPAPSS